MYVDANTRLACLPTMRDDVQAIFDEFLPGCTLPKGVRKNPDANDYHADVPTVPNHERAVRAGAHAAQEGLRAVGERNTVRRLRMALVERVDERESRF